MRLILTSCLLFPFLLFSQTAISGIINNYASVISYQEGDCGGMMVLDDVAGFEVGSLALVIQMKGAEINEGNTASFGMITQMGAAGYYELVHISAINGNEVSIAAGLINTYDFSALVQIVSIPDYEDAVVDAELLGKAWDGTTGGVIAIKASTLTLNAGINASGLGFRGGVADIGATNNCSALTNANDYWYEIANWRGAQKGEGIATIITGKESGRGPQANGGGGANDHNSGGGGGSNVTAGGQGGENREPSFFGCDGNFPGLGGRALPMENTRLFLGGGGGAGHENNDVGTDGGRGGGILIILADEFHGNGQIVQANGQNALTTLGADGAGGGGGGGTVVLISSVSDGLNIQTNGGDGGTANNGGDDRCMGPGGGGSGGRILTNFTLAPINYSAEGGAAGLSINSSACSISSNGANNGQSGVLESISNLSENNIQINEPSFLANTTIWRGCEGQSVVLNPLFEGENLNFQWEVNTGSGFGTLSDNEVYQGVNTEALTILSVEEGMENNAYRLILMSACFDDVVSEAFGFEVILQANALFTATVDGLEVSLLNASENADSYFWDFGDGGDSDLPQPTHIYDNGGVYTVSLTVTNECGEQTYTQVVELGVAPEAGFSNSHSGGCSPLEVSFTNESIGDYTTIEWSFPGGNPSTSTEEQPIVFYEVPGTYDVTLMVSGDLGESTITEASIIVVTPSPSASFDYEILAPRIISFENTSQNASYYNWNFGDGTTSTDVNPTHEYLETGVFEVTLNAQNNFCGNAFSSSVILLTATEDIVENGTYIYPNPVGDQLHVSSESMKLDIQIFDAKATLLLRKTISKGEVIDLSSFENGIYYIEIKENSSTTTFKLLKLK